MKHHFLIISLLSFISIITSNILDISDYTFYYTTYHYLLPSLTTNTTTFYNHQLSTNITITFTENISIILNNNIKLNLLNDNQWNEISIISQSNTPNKHTTNNKRRKLRNVQTEYSEEKQYEGVPHGKNWVSAQKYCKSTRRGHLATVLDEDDNYAVATECSALGTRWHCWLGVKRPFHIWINGEAVEYTNWLPGEPNNWGGDENCVEIYGTDEQIGFEEMWNSLKCNMMRGFVCERPPRYHPPPKPIGPLICDCDNINLNRDFFFRRRLAAPHCGKGCNKKLSKKQIRRRKKQRLKMARIRMYARARKRKRKRAAVRLARKRGRRRRKRWRAHLRRLRRKHRANMKREYKREMRMEKRRNAGYNLLNKLIGSALGNKHGGGARFGQVGELRRRLMDVHDCEYGYEMISRCKVVDDGRNYEICVNYNFWDMFLSIDVRFVDRKVLKNINDVDFSYRGHSGDVSDEFDGGYHVVERGEMFDPIEGNLGYAIWKYELMDWHGFNGESGEGKYGYGEYKKFDDYIHYFEEYELYFNNMLNDDKYVCSRKIGNLPFRMCMKVVSEDMMLYFEKDVDDGYVMDAKYSFQVKEFIDNRFENNVFYFNDDRYWDEISVVNVDTDMKWMKKCSFKLLIAKICIEQFHINDSRASIKFQSKNTYNASV